MPKSPEDNQEEQKFNKLSFASLKKASLIQLSDYILEEMPPLVYYEDNFYRFGGKCYELIDDYDFSQNIYNFFIEHAPSLYTPQKGKNIVETIKFHPHIKKIKEFDTYNNLINLSNGVLNFDTMEFSPHSPDYLFSTYINVNYEPDNLSAPNFINTLKGIFKRFDQTYDLETIQTVLQIGGYLMYPQNKKNYIFIFYGEGSNGKSIIVDEVYQMFFDQKFISGLSLNALSDENSFARHRLMTSRVNFSTEQRAGDIESEELKKIADGSNIEIARKFQANVTFRPKCKILVACNRLPRFQDQTYGTSRRLFIVKFNNKFEVDPKKYKEYQNPEAKGIYPARNYDDVVSELKQEKSAIFNLFLKSLQGLKENNWQFQKSANMDDVFKEYKEESDPVGEWLQEQYEEDKDQDSIMTLPDLYNLYKTWYQENNSNMKYMVTSRALARRVKDIFRIMSFPFSFRDGERVSTKSAFHLKKKENLTEVEKICFNQLQPTVQDLMDTPIQEGMNL